MAGEKFNWRRARVSSSPRHADAGRAVWMAKVATAESSHVSELTAYIQGCKTQPCTDCGHRYPAHVMQFDHLPGHRKVFNISEYTYLMPSLAILQEEIAKCEVVCANCHAERTHARRRAKRRPEP